MYKRRLKYYLIKFLRLRGAPSKLALGFAMGACVNFYPTFGVGIPIAGFTAGIIMASVPAGLIGDILFKPLFPVFFYLNLMTGYFLWPNEARNLNHIQRILKHPKLSNLGDISKVFFTGAVINTLILGTILYILIYFIVERYRVFLLKWLIRKNGRKL